MKNACHKFKAATCFMLPFLWSGLMAFFIFKLCERQVAADLLRPWAGLFLLFIGGGILFVSSIKSVRRIGLAFTLLLSASLACMICLYRYYKHLNAYVITDDIYAFMQSDFSESILFALNEIVTLKSMLIAIVVFLLSVTVILFSAKLLHWRYGIWKIISKKRLSLLSCLILLVGSIIMTQVRPIKLTYTSILQYNNEMAEFANIVSQFTSKTFTATKSGTGELYVVVIGESASRDFIHAYGGPYANSPWMDTLRSSSEWVVFNNAYAIHTHTMPVLQAALTDGRILTGLTFPKGKNLLQVAKAVDMHSIWLSNQAQMGPWDSSVSALANMADDIEFTGPLYSKNLAGSPPDEVLLPLLDKRLEQIDFSGNELLIIQLMGSHGPYASRYPADYNTPDLLHRGLVGELVDEPKLAPNYLTYVASLAYTDEVLSKIAGRLEQYADKPVVMFYFADHGEDVFSKSGSHDFKTFTWSMARIPMLLWMSDGWRERYPEKSALLQGRADSLFTNDLVYDLFLGLAGINVEGYDPKFDLDAVVTRLSKF